MGAHERTGTRRFACLMIILTLAAGLLPLASGMGAKTAFASGTGYLEIGGSIPYAGYSTNWMWVDGAPAFCANPSRATPASGTYEKHDVLWGANGLGDSDDQRRYQIRATLYHGWGGPGFDPSIWPSTWYDGSPMTDERYIALEHILLADLYSYELSWAVYGCDPAFKEYVRHNVTGYLASGPVPDFENTTRYKITETAAPVPHDFNAFILTAGSSQSVFSFEKNGFIEIEKTSANSSLTDGNACYSLEGAVFGIYEKSTGGEVTRITTDASGHARTGEIAPGTYLVRELVAPSGHVLNTEEREVTVAAGATATITVTDPPLSSDLGATVVKIDAETGENAPQGDATFTDAQFTYSYYDGYCGTASEAAASGAPKRTWVLRTDSTGSTGITLADKSFNAGEETLPYLVSGDDLYRNAEGAPTVPLGTLIITESKAPEGYHESNRVALVRFTQNGSEVERSGDLEDASRYGVEGDQAVLVNESVVRGGVSIEKRDTESQLITPLGNASLDGCVFAITNKSDRPVVVGGATFAPGDICKTVITEGGSASTTQTALPRGTYAIQEVSAGEGYLPTDVEPRLFTVKHDGAVVMLGADDTHDQAVYNQVKRGDVELVKAREADQARLAGIPFSITSLTTGETHVIVTDANGEAKTASTWNPHTQRTNANDEAINPDGSVDESKLDASAGVWFGLTSEGKTTQPDDSLAALPYDDYAIRELRVAANEGLELVTLERVSVTRDGYCIHLGTIDDQTPPEMTIATTARDALDGDKRVLADVEARVIDRVSYYGAAPGDYEMTASLIDPDTGEIVEVDGRPLTASRTFTADAATGYVEIEIGPIDARSLAGKSLVVFETVKDAETGEVKAEHTDVADFDQTVTFVDARVATSASDAADGDRVVACGPAAKVVDTITYTGLVPGASYIARAEVMRIIDEATGACEPFANEDGPLSVEKPFAPEAEAGEVDVEIFPVDVSDEDGAQLVVFETIYRATDDGGLHEVASHRDALDPAQTVTVAAPEISTIAQDAVDEDENVVADAKSLVRDTISFAGLEPGRPYEIIGALVNKRAYESAYDQAKEEGVDDEVATERALAASIVKSGQTPVTGNVGFTPESSSGSIVNEIEFDGFSVEEGAYVVFETLYADGVAIASHAKIDDESQTFGLIATETETLARDGVTGAHEAAADADALVSDSVIIRNVIAGETYTALGFLVDRETGLLLLDDPAAADREDLAEFTQELFTALGATVEDADGKMRIAFDDPGKTLDREAIEAICTRRSGIMAHLAVATSSAAAEGSEVEIKQEFAFDTSKLAGTEAVAYQFISKGGSVVDAHVDLESNEQTVEILASLIATNASDKRDGDKSIAPESGATVIDAVSYAHLVPGKTYVLEGVLIDKGTQLPLEINGEQVRSGVEFTPEEPQGNVEVVFEFDASSLDGSTLVAFETLIKNGETIAAHADLEDSDQTVYVEKIPREHPAGGGLSKTGDDGIPIAIALVFIATLSTTVVALAARAKTHRQ